MKSVYNYTKWTKCLDKNLTYIQRSCVFCQHLEISPAYIYICLYLGTVWAIYPWGPPLHFLHEINAAALQMLQEVLVCYLENLGSISLMIILVKRCPLNLNLWGCESGYVFMPGVGFKPTNPILYHWATRQHSWCRHVSWWTCRVSPLINGFNICLYI